MRDKTTGEELTQEEVRERIRSVRRQFGYPSYIGVKEHDEILRHLFDLQLLCEKLSRESFNEDSPQMKRLTKHLSDLHSTVIRMQDSLAYGLPDQKNIRKVEKKIHQIYKNFIDRGWMFPPSKPPKINS